MAWSSPKLFIVGEQITASILNTHIRDQLLFLGGTHRHSTGTAGEGTGDIGPLGVLLFADQSASPAGEGTMQRNGTHIEVRENGTTHVVSTVDLAVEVASMRTLGSDGTQATDGSHGHA